MLAVVSLVGAVLFAGQSSRLPSPDVLVVADAKFDEQMLSAECQKPIETGIAELKKVGFDEVTEPKTGSRILFAPKLWQGENIRRQLAFFKALGEAVKSDGTIDLSKNADLLGIAKSMFSSYDVDENSTVGADYQRSYQISVGEKQIWINTGPRINTDRLKDHPVTQPDKPHGDNFERFQATRVLWPNNYQVFGFGKYTYPNLSTNAALGKALTLLSNHIGEYFTTRQSAYQQMLSKIVPSAKGDWGKSFNDLSADEKSLILGEISSNCTKYGFSTSGDAEQWAQNAVLTGTNTSAYLSIFIAGQGVISFEVP